MSEAANKSRPQYTNIHVTQILGYRMPPAAIVSIMHRISGAFLFLLLPFVLFLLERSLTSELSFAYFQDFMSHWFVKLVALGLIWAFLHHFCAGLRHLVMDLHFWLTKKGANVSAAYVLVISLLLTLLVGLKLFGVF